MNHEDDRKSASEAFEVWKAKEKVRQAEARFKQDWEALGTTKSRSAALLGWCVSLDIAFVAAASHVATIEKFGSLLGGVALFFSGLLCVAVLLSTKLRPASFKPDELDIICDEYTCESELRFNQIYAHFLNEIIERNEKAISKDRQKLLLAWAASITGATIIFLSFIVGTLF